MVRTRFAPSPTGSLHLGNARVAVLNWLHARRSSGSFVLRIEDTDVERNIAGADRALLADLRWLRLDWDEGPREDGSELGDHGPYHQSQRMSLYAKQAAVLRATGSAYPCFCTDEALAERRESALAAGASPHYDRRCLSLSGEEVRRREQAGEPFALRFRVPTPGEVLVGDVIRGEIAFDAGSLGDFVLLRSDGRATYNFAVVVDDIAMEITDVIRGAGHLSNTPRQVLLFQAFGRPAPRFAHVPNVLGADRQILSKRHGARPLAEYRAEGYHPDGVLNYLSLLSWSSASGDEVLSPEQLRAEVELARIGSADVVFDPGKLRWLSAKHIERMPLEALVEAVAPFVDRERFPLSDALLPVAVGAVRTHLSTFSEINDHLPTFFPGNTPAPAAESGQAVVAAARRKLGEIEEWNEALVGEAIRAAGKEADARGRALYEPLRLALTGREHGPPLVAVLLVQGRDRSLTALDQAGRAP